MILTEPQRLTLKAFIIADPTMGPKTSGPGTDYAFISNALNTNASPDFWCWRTSVTKDEYLNSTSVDATVFAWTGTGFITRSQGERDAWREMFNDLGIVNPSKVNVRQAFTDIFSGATAPAPANRTHLSTVSRRKVNVAEKVFATGTGSTAVPGLLVVEGTVGIAEVGQILA